MKAADVDPESVKNWTALDVLALIDEMDLIDSILSLNSVPYVAPKCITYFDVL